VNKVVCALLVTIFIAALIVNTSILFGNASALSKSQKKAKDDLSKKLGQAVEGDYKSVCIGTVSRTINGSDFKVFQNKSSCYVIKPEPLPPVPICKPNEHLETNKCVPNPPEPKPNASIVASCVNFVGDIKLGNGIHDQLVKTGCDHTVILGDIYSTSTKDFIAQYSDLVQKIGAKNQTGFCDVGNHESIEDNEGGTIIKDMADYCGQYWTFKPNGNTMVLGFNSNGDLTKIGSYFTGVLKDATAMKGIKNVVVTEHKNCYINEGPHHKVESKVKALCDLIASNVPAGVKVWYIAGHEHNMQVSPDEMKRVSGAGGKSHYDCGTGWKCNDTDYGFFKLLIDDKTGTMDWTAFDIKGNPVNFN
jgi:hypothetical protein